jgi:hypothetical protein
LDCQQVAEVIDAYALGALSAEEARAVDEHVEGCVACWGLLREAEETAALVALTAPMKPAPNWLGQRIISEASRTAKRKKGEDAGILSRMPISWPAATGIFGTAAAAVLVFAFSLQLQVDDLEEDNDQIQQQFASTQASFGDIIRVATAEDSEAHEMEASEPAPSGAEAPEGEYRWSRTEGMGVIFCRDLPEIPEDQVYQAWYDTEPDPISAGTFEAHEGDCFHLMQPVVLVSQATGVGVTREREGGSDKPSGRWLIFTDLED